MEYNDGSRFGYDTVQPYEEHVPAFESARLAGGTVRLLARNEMPRRNAAPVMPHTLVEVPTTKNIEAFSATGPAVLSAAGTTRTPDIHYFVLILLVLVVCVQLRMLHQVESLWHMQMMQGAVTSAMSRPVAP